METVISTDQRIRNSLLLNASFIDNLGMMHGKMGISICFFHLARQNGNQIYEDYAGELIDEIYEEITTNTPVDFENGLAGIGWGIEYLVQNGFIEADTDEVLEEFDNRIFKELIYNTPKEIGLLDGIIGIGVYYLKRIQNPTSSEKIPVLTNKQTLIHLIDELDRKIQNITEIISEPLISPNNCRTIEPSNPQTPEKKFDDCSKSFDGCSKRSSTVVRTPEPLNLFDLTWNYPTLLWFLAELYEQNIFNFKVEKIIQRLIEPLTDETNLPKLHSNRLLLALTLTKLLQTTNSGGAGSAANQDNPAEIDSPVVEFRGVGKQQTMNDEQSSNPQTPVKQPSNSQISVELLSSQTIIEQQSNLQTTTTNLLTGITRNIINSELPKNNVIIRYGTSGIAWVYRQLHHLTGDNHFKEEMEYWTNQTGKSEITNEAFPGTDTKKNYGILEGLSGNLLLNEIRKQLKQQEPQKLKKQ